jgi:undecaprenyl-diphosphatase
VTRPRALSFFTPPRLVAGFVVVLALASLVCTLTLDGSVVEQLSRRPFRWDRILWIDAFRSLGNAVVPIWLVALFTVVTRRARPLMTTLAALLLSAVVVVPLKNITQRQRPYAVLMIRDGIASPQMLRAVDKASFPSGDTSTAFAVATAVAAYLSGILWPLLYAGAIGIGILRVIYLSHYPSDVCFGAAVGIFSGYVALRLVKAYLRPEWLGLLVRPTGRSVLAGIVLAAPLVIALLFPGIPLLVFLKVYGAPLLAICVALFVLGRRRQDAGSPPPAVPD